VERRLLAACVPAQAVLTRNRNVIKLDPTFHDAELTIGIYDYIVGTLPLPVRMLATLPEHMFEEARIQTLDVFAKEGQ